MSYKDIIVFIDPGPHTATRISAAVRFAAPYEARLVGVDITATAGFDGDWKDHENLHAWFEEETARAGLEHDYRTVNRYAATAQDFLCHEADLLVATQPNWAAADHLPSLFPERVLMTAGVPMLILPGGWGVGPSIGLRPVLAWNASREATRAMHDAMPILERAKDITLFTFGAALHPHSEATEEILAHLRQHGVAATVDGWHGDGDIMDALLACIGRKDADLIVAGAYGHPRWYERLFGGTTQALLNQDLLPVLTSH